MAYWKLYITLNKNFPLGGYNMYVSQDEEPNEIHASVLQIESSHGTIVPRKEEELGGIRASH